MTTAPTPSRADALIREHRASMHPETLRAWASDAVDELRRLQAENERLQKLLKCDTPRYCSSVQRCTAGDEHRAKLEARKPLPLSYQSGVMTSGVEGGATVSLHFNDATEAEEWFEAITDQFDSRGITGGSS